MKNTYLSIDIDFWNSRSVEDFGRFMQRVWDTKLPITIVDNHDRLLPSINHSGCDTIINIDYHSDIANNDFSHDSPKLPELNCGTWGNWVKNRKSFSWLHPHNVMFELAYCHEPQTDRYSPFKHPEYADYERVTQIGIYNLPAWIFNDVREIGIACSYKWLEDWEHSYTFENKASKAGMLIKILKKIFGDIPANSEPFYFISPVKMSSRKVIKIA